MLTQTDGEGHVTEHRYNARSLARSIIDAEGGTESYRYYANGGISESTDRKGITTSFEYDIHGRLLNKTANGETVSFTYDNNGNELTMTDKTGTTVRQYDGQSRVTQKTTPEFGVSVFTYDITAGLPAGQVAETSQDPEGNITKRIYDKVGRLLSVEATGDATNYLYYDNGNMQRVTYPNNAYTQYAYYANNKLQTMQSVNHSGATVEAYNYGYDGNGNQTEVLDNHGTTEYEYNALNQLEIETLYNGKVTKYEYDDAGNRSDMSVYEPGASEAELTVYTYNSKNMLTKTETEKHDGKKEIVDFQYDNNGNMHSKTKSTLKPETGGEQSEPGLSAASDLVTLYEHDVWNNMVKTTQGGTVVENVYNGRGQRVEKTAVTGEESNTKKYLYEGMEVVLELDEETDAFSVNVYGHALISRRTGQNRSSFMYNGHGDVTKVIDESSRTVASYYYDAFGNLLEDESEIDNPYKYAGYQHDAETGLYYLNARYYDPEIARFIQEDTYRGSQYDPLSLNLYTYCSNNPVMYTDPSGHYVSSTDKANLTPSQIAGIEKATNDWNNANAAGDKAGMAAANAAANAIRGSAGYSGGSDGNTITVGSGSTVKTVTTNATTTVTNSGTITNMNVNSGADVSIINQGVIGTINNSGILDLNNTGTIGTINMGENSTANITNSGTIWSINTSGGSNTNLINSGTIHEINSNVDNNFTIEKDTGEIGSINRVTVDAFSGTDDNIRYVVQGGAYFKRVDPSTNIQVLVPLPIGAKVTFLGRIYKDSDGQEWAVIMYEGKIGTVQRNRLGMSEPGSGNQGTGNDGDAIINASDFNKLTTDKERQDAIWAYLTQELVLCVMGTGV